MKTRVVTDIGSADIGSLHADTNSVARNILYKSWVRLVTIWNLNEGLSKACKRHNNIMDNKDGQLRKWFWAVTLWLLVGEVV
jgi:hypothetical protein